MLIRTSKPVTRFALATNGPSALGAKQRSKEALGDLFSAKGMKIVLADQMIDQSLKVASFLDQLQDAPSGMDVRLLL